MENTAEISMMGYPKFSIPMWTNAVEKQKGFTSVATGRNNGL